MSHRIQKIPLPENWSFDGQCFRDDCGVGVDDMYVDGGGTLHVKLPKDAEDIVLDRLKHSRPLPSPPPAALTAGLAALKGGTPLTTRQRDEVLRALAKRLHLLG